MPIKFHCKFCQQFLGVSRSKAGAVVDCPQCGRFVQVPEFQGRTNKPPSISKPANDAALISALSELSALDDGSTEELWPAGAPEEFSSANSQYPENSDSVAQKAHSSIQEDWPQTFAEPAYSEPPVALSESLSELASLNDDFEDQPVSTELLQDMRQARAGHSWLSMPAAMLSLVATLGGVAGGWWLSESNLVKLELFRTGKTNINHTTRKQPTTFPNRLGNDQSPEESSTADAVVQGTVEFQDSTGQLLPDANALVLLLPNARRGTLLLDAQSLHQPTYDPDFLATKAALNSLGGTIVRTTEDGLFAVSHNPKIACKVIVISKHIDRPDNIPLASEAERLLKTYFQSPNNLCGRQSVQMAEANNYGPLNFQFDAH